MEVEEPRYVFFLHWSWLVPEEIWSRHECVCFHMTDVPYGRGGSPLQNLIMAGKKDTVLTALRMIEQMDAGPVYAKRPLSLSGRAEDIYLRAGDLSLEVIRWMIHAEPQPIPQKGSPTVFARRKPEQSRLPAEESVGGIYDRIRMLDAPTYPLAFIEHGNYRLEFSHAQLLDGELSAKVVFRQSQEPEEV
jgi:methionyl-tRNA formyltransferase